MKKSYLTFGPLSEKLENNYYDFDTPVQIDVDLDLCQAVKPCTQIYVEYSIGNHEHGEFLKSQHVLLQDGKWHVIFEPNDWDLLLALIEEYRQKERQLK